ncbi:MAG: hypothetical protein K5756_07765 [Clostridiales bacterium]|nr:hypothetical protein [Clostridiales bacterium]
MKSKKLPVFLGMTGISVFILCLTVYPALASKGVRDALNLCGQVMIPSLFPFMVICSFIVKLNTGGRPAPVSKKVMGLLFRLPSNALPVVLLGLTAGFPVGAAMTSQLFREKRLTGNQARRLMAFCVNCGPVFALGTVGSAMLGSKKAGAIIFVSLLVSSLTIGFISRFFDDGSNAEVCVSSERPEYLKAMVSSVSDASQAMLSVCAWIIFFGCICSLLSLLPSVSLPLTCIFEVSSGCMEGVKHGFPIPLLAAIIGWAGISVHCQIMPYLCAVGMPLPLFFSLRLLNGGLAAAVCSLLLKLFPCEIPAMLNSAYPVTLTCSAPPVAAGVIIMCSILILDLDIARKV